ncbi:MAG: hypothetical protein PUE04_00820 [Lachnospira sp.]|nr:hypothetical protein [Lachnospira sp.]
MVMILAAAAVIYYALAVKRRNRFLSAALYGLLGIGWLYFFHPPLNIHSYEFWLFIWLMICIGALLLVRKKGPEIALVRSSGKKVRKSDEVTFPLFRKALIALAVFAACWAVIDIASSPLFHAGGYAQRIAVSEVSFSEIPSFNFQETAIIDRESAQLVGDKVMGEMTDLVSQFDVSTEYNQISYEQGTYRVTPLAYSGFIKYMRNRVQGVPGYILVNTTTGNAQLTRLERKMRYVPSGYFNDNLYRRLQFAYPTELFGTPTFEIDDEGNPYYVCTTYTYTGLHAMKKVTGVVLYDPTDGSSSKYTLQDVPSWADRVYPESLIDVELNDYGRYQKGFFNSIFGQEGVIRTSEGYNYISKDGDIWLYTGMTSAASDQSNIGFMLVDLRTHRAQYTTVSCATETAVMASAEGEVLNYGYKATFPTLINAGGKPVYLLSLKDSAGLIKMYAMVDAQDYQQVYTARAEKDSGSAITGLLKQTGGGAGSAGNEASVTFAIEALNQMNINGSTVLYLKGDGQIYRLDISEENAAETAFLTVGDQITCTYYEDGTGTRRILDLQ